jgi:hypothetical protein
MQIANFISNITNYEFGIKLPNQKALNEILPSIQHAYYKNWYSLIQDLLGYLNIERVSMNADTGRPEIKFRTSLSVSNTYNGRKITTPVKPDEIPTSMRSLIDNPRQHNELENILIGSLIPLYEAGLKPWPTVMKELEERDALSPYRTIPDLKGCLFLDLVYKLFETAHASGHSPLGLGNRLRAVDYIKEALSEFDLLVDDTDISTLLDELSSSEPISYYHWLDGSLEAIPELKFEIPGEIEEITEEFGPTLITKRDPLFWYIPRNGEAQKYSRKNIKPIASILENYYQIFKYNLTSGQDETIANILRKKSLYWKVSRGKKYKNKNDTPVEILPLYSQMAFLYLGQWLKKYLGKNEVFSILACKHSSNGNGLIDTTVFRKMGYCNLTENIEDDGILNPSYLYKKSNNGNPNRKERCILNSVYISYICACMNLYFKKYDLLRSKFQTTLYYAGRVVSPVEPQKFPVENLDEILADSRIAYDQEKSELVKTAPKADEFIPFIQEAFRIGYLLRHSTLFRALHYYFLAKLYKKKLNLDIRTLDIKNLPGPSLFNSSLTIYLLSIKQPLTEREITSEFKKYQECVNVPLETSGHDISLQDIVKATETIYNLGDRNQAPGEYLLSTFSRLMIRFAKTSPKRKTVWQVYFNMMDSYREFSKVKNPE